jgi:hypothetical protein
MKLWLDDARPAPEGWTWAKNIEDARRLARDAFYSSTFVSEFEECSLDHDLGNGEFNDGIYFIDWMAENCIWPDKKPVVHSMNPVGRMRMELTINRNWTW